MVRRTHRHARCGIATRQRERGVAAVEFALLATLMITLMLGASEFGRAMFQYNTLVKSVRAAARHASNAASSSLTVATEAKSLAVYGSTDGTGSALVPGLTTAMVTIGYAADAGDATITDVTATITGLQFQPLASWLLPAFTFEDITAVMTQPK